MKLHRILSLCAASVMCVALSGCAQRSEIPLADSDVQTSSQTVQSTVISSAPDVNSSIPRSSVTSAKLSVTESVSVQSTSTSAYQPVNELPAASSPHVHDYAAEIVAPTCSEAGYTVYTCACGEQYTSDTVEAVGHDYEKSVTEPTCTEDGCNVFTCSRCGHSYKEEIAAAGHKYSSKTIAPTCSESGYTLHTCETCGDEYTDSEVSALGHSWGEWSVYRAPTASAEGEQRRECSRCGEAQSEAVARLVANENYAERVVELVNAERAKYGLSPLSTRSDLTEYAGIRSSEIVTRFAHARPDGSNPLSYVLGLSGIHCAGENIAWGQRSPEDVMNAWMNSEGHRKNILSANYTTIGVGCYNSGGTLYWTQIFGG